jgi:hypothetical protein
MIEDFAFPGLRAGDEVLVEHVEDVGANVLKLVLDLLTVCLDLGDLGLVAL